jgi:hypothetical protein
MGNKTGACLAQTSLSACHINSMPLLFLTLESSAPNELIET